MAASHIGTAIAQVERDEEGLIWVRVHEGARLDVKGFAEVIAARKELAQGRPAGVIVTVPEDVDFDVHIVQVDHYASMDAAAFTAAFAIVTSTGLHTKMFDLYTGFFKTAFPAKTFDGVEPALAWVREHL